jgi:hypothetical protein
MKTVKAVRVDINEVFAKGDKPLIDFRKSGAGISLIERP